MVRSLYLAALFCAAAPAAWAQIDGIDLPQRKPGLWLQTTTIGEMHLESKACVDRGTDKAMLLAGMNKMKDMGLKMSVTGGGDTYTIHTTAAIPDHTINSTMVLHFINDSAIHGDGKTHIDPPFEHGEMPTDSSMQQDSKWIGPCPADMKPGDVITNGRKTNLLQGGG
jgi:hypothetical protein